MPGLPKPVVLRAAPEGRPAGRDGDAGLGARNGHAHARARSPDASLGYYASPRVEVIRFTRDGFSSSPLAVDLDTGAFRRAAGRAGERLGVRQYEVRIPVSGAVLAGTLTLPPGPGPFPAAVYVSGSGPTLREESHWLDSRLRLARRRRARLRQARRRPVDGALSREPRERATIGLLAGDAVAAARFLGAQPGIDRPRVGFYGLSQAGWIIPQAVGRAGGAVSWALIESGPTVTQGESDTYANSSPPACRLPRPRRRPAPLGPSGYDPSAVDRAARDPVLWLYAGRDRAQPTRHSTRDPPRARPPATTSTVAVLRVRAALALRPDRLPRRHCSQRVAGWLAAHSLG